MKLLIKQDDWILDYLLVNVVLTDINWNQEVSRSPPVLLGSCSLIYVVWRIYRLVKYFKVLSLHEMVYIVRRLSCSLRRECMHARKTGQKTR